MLQKEFTHLHLHTEYSLLDGAIKLEALVKRIQECQMKSVAITDHGNIFGAVKFFQKCKNAGINFEFFLMDEFSWWIIKNRKERSDYSAYVKFVVDEMPESMRANYWYGRNCHLNNKDQLAKMDFLDIPDDYDIDN